LWEARGRAWAEAIQAYQRDRRLARFAEGAADTERQLRQLKLYPPYPLDEPRRAAAIRQFNGLAAEARRLIGTAADAAELDEQASTKAAEAAAATLRQLAERIAEERSRVAAAASADDHVEATERLSHQVGADLGTHPQRRLGGHPVELLGRLG
jgi:hypothetical protein